MPITSDCNALLQQDRLRAILAADPLVNDLWLNELQGYAIEQPVSAAVAKPEIALFLANESLLWSTTESDSEPRLYVLYIAYAEPSGEFDARVMTRNLINVTAAMRDALRRVTRDPTAGTSYWHNLTFGGSPNPEIPVGNVSSIYSREPGKSQYSRTFFSLHSRVRSARRG